MTRYLIVPTKSQWSTRIIPMPPSVMAALRRRATKQQEEQVRAGTSWHESDLVFTTGWGTPIHPPQ